MFFTLWELIIVNKQLTHLTLKRNTFEASIWITICKIFHKMEGLLRNKQNQFRLCFHFHHCMYFVLTSPKVMCSSSTFQVVYQLLQLFLAILTHVHFKGCSFIQTVNETFNYSVFTSLPDKPSIRFIWFKYVDTYH